MFDNVRNNATLCSRIVDLNQLDADIAADTVPQVVYITPNMNNDGHDTSVTDAANWMENWLEPRRQNPALAKGTLFVLTFDENESYTFAPKAQANIENRVLTVFFGEPTLASAGQKISTPYTHYSLLRTIEDNWSLGTLGRNDDTAQAIVF